MRSQNWCIALQNNQWKEILFVCFGWITSPPLISKMLMRNCPHGALLGVAHWGGGGMYSPCKSALTICNVPESRHWGFIVHLFIQGPISGRQSLSICWMTKWWLLFLIERVNRWPIAQSWGCCTSVLCGGPGLVGRVAEHYLKFGMEHTEGANGEERYMTPSM